MKFSGEFQNNKLAKNLVQAILKLARLNKFNFMDVCGTHTVNIFKFGIKSLLPPEINLVSGPGCPVCVTSEEEVDYAMEICRMPDTILLTFGDMLKVPGSHSSLEKEKSMGADIRVLYSPMDAFEICKKNLSKKVVFFAIGFETTSPTIAATLVQAKKEGIKNFFIYPSHKLIPPAMKAILEAGEVKLDGFICPGHVSTIIGSSAYEFISGKYSIPCVITGFEPLDILQGIYMLLRQVTSIRKSGGKARVEVQYKRCVTGEGNKIAKDILSKVFKVVDVEWRGLGMIPDSGLALHGEYERFDIRNCSGAPTLSCESPHKGDESKSRGTLSSSKVSAPNKKECRCGEVLRGVISPKECHLFAKKCTPESPRGPCMVSSEGTCSAHYNYSRNASSMSCIP